MIFKVRSSDSVVYVTVSLESVVSVTDSVKFVVSSNSSVVERDSVETEERTVGSVVDLAFTKLDGPVKITKTWLFRDLI